MSSFAFLKSLHSAPWLLRIIISRLKTLNSALPRLLNTTIAWLLKRIPTRNRRLLYFEARCFRIRRVHAIIAGVLLAKALQWLLRRLLATRSLATARLLKTRMEEATNYETWAEAARELDALEKRTVSYPSRPLAVLRDRTHKLQTLREDDNVLGLMWMLRDDTSRNVGALMANAAERARVHSLEPPPVVLDYVEEMQKALHHIAHCRELSLQERLAFVKELRHAYGRTGLVLSGGGSFGHFHYGVNRELLQFGLLPRVLSGSSAGAIACALLCTRTDAEILETVDSWPTAPNTDFFGEDKPVKALLKHFLTKGTLHSADDYVLRLQRLMGDLTFQEAYSRSGRVLNISVVAVDTQEPCRVLNYLTAPNVLVWSAVAASSAFPLLFTPHELLMKDAHGRIVKHHAPVCCSKEESLIEASGTIRRWCDGSLEEDLPMRGLGEMFGVNYFLVSQCNPWLVPVLAICRLFPPKLVHLVELEVKHRCGQILAIWPKNKLCKLISQPWRGDLNFLLPVSAFPLLRSAVNFTSAEIIKAMQEGQRAVWAKLPAIRAACAVEVAIDAELRALTMQARAARRREEHAAGLAVKLRASIPSWMDLKSLGLANGFDSTDDVRSLGGPKTPRGSTDRMLELPLRSHSQAHLFGSGGGGEGASRSGYNEREMETEEGGEEDEMYGDMEAGVEPWEAGQLVVNGGTNGAGRRRLESGLDVWRDMTWLAMGAEGLDVIAP